MEDLRELLSKGTIVEQKAFLRSFIKRIEVHHPHIALEYTIPLKRQKVELLSREVLPFETRGSPGRTRTSDQLVNSQPLYRLSYRGIVPDIIPYSDDSSRVKCQRTLDIQELIHLTAPHETVAKTAKRC